MFDDAITVQAARERVMGQVRRTATTDRELSAAAGYHLAQAVIAPYDHPLFDMSAVDGYAFAFDTGVNEWCMAGAVAAGDVLENSLRRGECVRIFTGAMLPGGADTVVMQEFVQERDGVITHQDTKLGPGGNVRRKGEQLRAGDELLGAGSCLDPASVGLLATAGVHGVVVHERPTVSIVRTGGEFADPRAPEPGRIFSSNELMLAAALAREGIGTAQRVHAPRDDRDELRGVLMAAVEVSDVVISTGGVSVGEHDLVSGVLKDLGAAIHVHGVRQKPGKPMLFATLGRTAIFGLPGNPRAVLVAWHLYVRPFLRAMQGDPRPWPASERLPLATGLRWKGGRTGFRAGTIRGGQVHPLPDEGSHMLLGMTAAEVLVELPAELGELPAAADVTVHYLPRG